MPRRRWWENTKSRKLALAGAIGYSLILAAFIYLLITDLTEGGGDFWKTLVRFVFVLLGIFAVASWWTNWLRLRPEK